MIVGLVLLAVFLAGAQVRSSVVRQESNSLTKLSIAAKRLAENAQEAQENLATYDAFSQAKVDTLALFLDRNPDSQALDAMAAQWGLQGYWLVSSDGKAQPSQATIDGQVLSALLSDRKPVSMGNERYYAAAREDGGLLVGSRDASKENEALSLLTSPAHALSTIKVGTSGYIVAVDPLGRIAYHPDESWIGQPAKDKGLALNAGYDGWAELADGRYYCISQQAGELTLISALPRAEMTANVTQMVLIALAAVFVVLTLLVSYALFLRRDQAKRPYNAEDYQQIGKKLYLDRVILRKIGNIALIGVVAVFAISFYIQSLTALSRQALISSAKLDAVDTLLDGNQGRINELKQEYSDEYAQRAKNIAYTLSQDPALSDDAGLRALRDKAQVSIISLFNPSGRITSSSGSYAGFQLSSDQSDQSYPFWEVVKGYRDELVQDAQEDETHNYIQYVGVRRLDQKGMVQVGLQPQRLKNRLRATALDYVIGEIAVENGGFLFAVDKQDGTLLSYPTSKYIGRLAANYGLGQAALKDNYMGYQTLGGQKCLVGCMERDEAYILIAVPTSVIFASRLSMTAIATLSSLLVILIICAFLVFGGKPEEKAEAPETEQTQSTFFQLLLPSGRRRTVQSAASRWSGQHLVWSERSPEQKLSRTMTLMLGVAALALTTWLWVTGGSNGQSSILSYILGREWEHSVNLFSLTYIGIVLTEVMVLSSLARWAIEMITRRFGARSETIGRLLDSFIKYVSVLAAIFYCLNFVGVDGTALITSAGILTLVVGLGAQSLISDIIAGVFIVFEGEFRVGDIVTIGDWRGTVMEIGIRTTKIESAGNDIKIFNNSAISGVINMTKQYSYAFTDIGIEYGESLEHVESILNRELPAIKDRLPSIVAGPYYKGVSTLGDSSVNIRIVAQCKEDDRVQLTRDLNRELKLVFDRNNISIPFPQIVLNQPAEHQAATKREKREAEAFVEEQKELTKDIQISDNN